MNFSNAKISVYNWAIIGLMAITFIVAAKMVFSRYKVPGVSEIVTMA
jgi:hypothetical protein